MHPAENVAFACLRKHPVLLAGLLCNVYILHQECINKSMQLWLWVSARRAAFITQLASIALWKHALKPSISRTDPSVFARFIPVPTRSLTFGMWTSVELQFRTKVHFIPEGKRGVWFSAVRGLQRNDVTKAARRASGPLKRDHSCILLFMDSCLHVYLQDVKARTIRQLNMARSLVARHCKKARKRSGRLRPCSF